jgi:hypothetical protein
MHSIHPPMTGVMLVNNWTSDVNDILDKIRINSIVLSNEHKKTYFMLSSRIKWFRVPVIFLSALGSVFGIGLSPYLPQLMISEICSAMSLVVGLIGSIELFLAISTKMESELVQSKELYLLAIEIQKTLLLDMENRNGDGMAYLEDKFNVYSKLIENSYLLECKIMDELTPLPNEFQSKISANHSLENTPRRYSKMPLRRSKQAIMDINMMKKPHHHRVAPFSPSLPDSPSPLPDSPSPLSDSPSPSNDTNILANHPPMPTSEVAQGKGTHARLPNLEATKTLLTKGLSVFGNPTLGPVQTPPVSVPDDLPRPIHRRGSNPKRQIVASRRSIVRLVSSETPQFHENSIKVPPLNLNFTQLEVPPRSRRRSSIVLPNVHSDTDTSPPQKSHKECSDFVASVPKGTGTKGLRQSDFGSTRCDRPTLSLPIESILPEYQEFNPSSPIRRCATSESKPKSKIPTTASFIDLRKEGRHENIPSFHSRHRRHSFEFIPPSDYIPITNKNIQAQIHRALMATTPYISENPSPDNSIH